MPKKSSGPAPQPSPLGGEIETTVTLRDGATEPVTLRELTVRQLYRFIEHLGGDDMPALVALCAGQPPEWVDTLSDASFAALLPRCIEANFPRAVKLTASDPFTAARLAPLYARLNRATTLLGAGTTSSAPSPAPAASASAAATGSAS